MRTWLYESPDECEVHIGLNHEEGNDWRVGKAVRVDETFGKYPGIVIWRWTGDGYGEPMCITTMFWGMITQQAMNASTCDLDWLEGRLSKKEAIPA